MKLLDIARKVGTGILREIVPGSGFLLNLINNELPTADHLTKEATGADLAIAIDKIPADKRAELMGREFDVEIIEIQETNATLRTMLESDAANPHTTRPYIAKQSFHVVAYTAIVAVILWAAGVATDNPELVTAVTDGWPFVLAVTAPFVTLLYAYFGILKHEHKNRLQAAGGGKLEGVGSAIADFIKNRGKS